MASYSTALSAELHNEAAAHLLRGDGQEDLCFALWYSSQGRDRHTALIHSLILPENGEREVRGNVSFSPNYFERAMGCAVASGAGLALLHSHIGPGCQGMSEDDVSAEQGHAAAVKGATGFPFAGLTIGTDGAWSARFWEKTAPRTYERHWCRSVRVVGDRLSLTFARMIAPHPSFRPELARTISAWGPEVQADLARLCVGVIGAGSVGSIVAEALARMGVTTIRLIDFDDVEIENLDRLLHATGRDVALHRSKVEVLARGLEKSATADHLVVEALEWSLVEEQGFRAALDCDVLFCCVDRPWPRSVLNLVAYAHLIPVVDGGVLVTTRRGGVALRHADVRAHIAAPGRKCLECLGQYEPGSVSSEREGYLDDPTYIAGLPKDHPVHTNRNVFAFGMSAASFEVLQLLSLVVAPSGLGNLGAQMYHCVTGRLDTDYQGCKDTCFYPKLIARGDRSGVVVTGRHRRAEELRERRRQFRRSWPGRIARWKDRLWSNS